jgi:hypothetical protein
MSVPSVLQYLYEMEGEITTKTVIEIVIEKSILFNEHHRDYGKYCSL